MSVNSLSSILYWLTRLHDHFPFPKKNKINNKKMFTPANLSQLFGFYFTFKNGWDCLFLLYKEIYNIMDKDEYLGLPRILFIHQEIFFPFVTSNFTVQWCITYTCFMSHKLLVYIPVAVNRMENYLAMQ